MFPTSPRIPEGQALERTVRSMLIIVPSLGVNLLPGVLDRLEPAGIQAFFSGFSIEGFSEITVSASEVGLIETYSRLNALTNASAMPLLCGGRYETRSAGILGKRSSIASDVSGGVVAEPFGGVRHLRHLAEARAECLHHYVPYGHDLAADPGCRWREGNSLSVAAVEARTADFPYSAAAAASRTSRRGMPASR